jgi:transposase
MIPMLPQISQSAAMRRHDICIHVSRSNRARLEAIIADRNSSSKAVWRAEIVLATADGLGTNAIMKRTGKSKPCVWRWQERYVEEGVDGLLRDKTRPPGKKPLSAAVKRKVLAKTASETPPDATHWIVRRFKISNDPQFEEKVTDVVGLYMNPPDRALVLCVDEKRCYGAGAVGVAPSSPEVNGPMERPDVSAQRLKQILNHPRAEQHADCRDRDGPHELARRRHCARD